MHCHCAAKTVEIGFDLMNEQDPDWSTMWITTNCLPLQFHSNGRFLMNNHATIEMQQSSNQPDQPWKGRLEQYREMTGERIAGSTTHTRNSTSGRCQWEKNANNNEIFHVWGNRLQEFSQEVHDMEPRFNFKVHWRPDMQQSTGGNLNFSNFVREWHKTRNWCNSAKINLSVTLLWLVTWFSYLHPEFGEFLR